jgi:branched-chain amino acid transport system substrate-binding protein
MLRTGILLPRSTLFPSIGLDIHSGLKEYLKLTGIDNEIEFLTGNIGFGTNDQEIYTKVEKMLLDDEIDVLVLCADIWIAELLKPLFTATEKILLVINFGANFPDNWQAAPTTIFHSLNFCLHAALSGKLAAEESDSNKTINLTSYYDGGYRQCYSMIAANQEFGAGTIYNHVTSLHIKEFTLEPVDDFLATENAKCDALCLFAGDQALRFYEAIAPLQEKYGLKLYGSPMMFDISLNKILKEKEFVNIGGYIPWYIELDNSENRQFTSVINSANYFSLLGWETGMLLQNILELYRSGAASASVVIKEMENKSWQSPRGHFTLDAATHYSYGPSYLVKRDAENAIEFISQLNGREEWIWFVNRPPMQGESSGWKNSYLCA